MNYGFFALFFHSDAPIDLFFYFCRLTIVSAVFNHNYLEKEKTK